MTDLTRYRIVEISTGPRNFDADVLTVHDKLGVPVGELTPDTTLQDIADAWGIVMPDERRNLRGDWPMLMPLFVELDKLEGTDK